MGEEEAMEDEEVELDSDEECDHIDEDKVEAKADEDPTSLQLAWEVLELSKLICKEQLEAGDKKTLTSETKAALEKRYCETFLLLSEVKCGERELPAGCGGPQSLLGTAKEVVACR